MIFGDDLVWRGDRWVAQPGASHDSAVKRAPLEEFDRAVRNTYKVLLTRGMLGSVLYRTDPETQELLSLLVRRAPLALMLSTDDLAQQPGWQRILSP